MAVAQDMALTLGDRLAISRRRAGKDQKDMAREVGVSRPLVSKWECNKSVPDVLQALRWAEVTGIDLLALVGEGGKMAQTYFGDLSSPSDQQVLLDETCQPLDFAYPVLASVTDLASRRAS